MHLATSGSSADGSLPGQCQVGWDFPHCGQWEEGRQVGMGPDCPASGSKSGIRQELVGVGDVAAPV